LNDADWNDCLPIRLHEQSQDMISPKPLPHFRRPPVTETVLGVQFTPLPDFSSGWLGAFWRALGPEWSSANDASALEPVHEEFGVARSWRTEGFGLKFMQIPAIRLQIRNAAGDRMIQIQNGRLHYNWVRQGAEYPTYDRIRPEFDQVLASFRTFLSEQGTADLPLNQWEVTYVNRIPRGELWDRPSDWAKVLRLVQPIRTMDCLDLETQGGNWHFEITPRRGRLHVELRHGTEAARRGMTHTATEFLVLNLTARGPVASDEAQGMTWSDGLDCGREMIVRSFFDMTTEEAHERWEVVR
jgi:uncharacterized protein (TIGR04255 family)